MEDLRLEFNGGCVGERCDVFGVCGRRRDDGDWRVSDGG